MKTGFILFLILFSQTLWAGSFEELWSKFYQQSLKQKSAQDEVLSVAESKERADRHWMPRVFVAGQWFKANDPGQVFINQLGQRAITQSDFTPSLLNHPDRSTFKTGALGVDLPLFEGGMKVAQASMYQDLLKASEVERAARKTEDYVDLAKRYGDTLILSHYERSLKDLQTKIAGIVRSYQVGETSNPVGHSGLLGLRGVNNRVEGLLNQNSLSLSLNEAWIQEKASADISSFLNPSQSVDEFVAGSLSTTALESSSTMIQAQELKLQAFEKTALMERARYTPRVGLFAQNNLYSGARSTTNSQTYGLYLQWDLFNPDSYGRRGEAQAQARAQNSKLLAQKQEERIAVNELEASRTALERSLKIISESESILGEQVKQSMRLFSSGLLTALQLSEVFNRRVDLLENRSKIELQYLDVRTKLYQLTH